MVPNYQCHGHQISLNNINQTQLTQAYIIQNEFLQTLIRKFTELKRSRLSTKIC